MSGGVLKLGWVLFCITTTAVSQESNGERLCFNSWQGDLVSREEKCDIFSGPTTLSMVCRINMGSKPNVSLQWFYADQEDEAGLNGVTLNSGSSVSFNFSVEVTDHDDKFTVAMLKLHSDFALGYYWCQVIGAMDSQFQNPSRIMRISTTCHSGIMCTSDTLSTYQSDSGRCANGNYPENITILDVQDTSACLEPPTDGAITTTEGDGKTADTLGGGDGSEATETTEVPSTSTSTGIAATRPAGGTIGGLPTGAIWLIVGLGISLLLVIIALLLVIITCMHCTRRKVKDNSGDNMPHHFDNLAYLSTEPGLSDSYANSSDDKQLADIALTGNHTYAVIPENFTLTAFSGEHSPTQQTKQTPPAAVGGAGNSGGFHHSLPGDYEIIDLEPVPKAGDGKSSTRKHQYEAVTNDEDDENYNRLQRSDSKSRKASCSTSGSSVSPVLRGESTTPLSPTFKETTTLFDNPKYSQLSKLGGQHISIYKTTSTDSTPGAAASQSDVPAPPVVKKKASKTLSSQSNKDDEYFHDSSVFIVNGLAQDEAKLSSIVQKSDVPSEHYSSLLPATMNEESSYAHAIVSSKDKYVSERGHLYQVLEGELEEAGETDKERKRANFASLSVESKDDDELGFTVNNPDACSTDDDDIDETSSPITLGSRSGVVYNTLLRTPTSENSRESSPSQATYDVIDRNAKHSAASSRNSLDNELAYNVIDRRISDGNFSCQPPSQYDLIEPQARRISEGYLTSQPQARKFQPTSSQYDVTEPQARKASCDVTSPLIDTNGYSMITRSRNPSVISFTPQKSLDSSSSPPPPTYSSLVIMEGQATKGNNIHTMEETGEKGVCQENDVIYHTIST